MTSSPTVTPDDVRAAERLFATWIGFDFHGGAPRRLRDFLVSRAARLEYNTVHGYLADLPSDRPESAEAQRLINIVTNGLTAFWRDEKQIEALGIILAQQHEKLARPLAVWCAGCATGEEAYTVSLLAAELGVEVNVLGTDVNTTFLDAARRGEYDDWSLRRLDPSRRDEWFELREGRWALRQAARHGVEFRHHNLLDSPPAAPNATGMWDVVMCRNVVIYLTQEAMDAILLRFASVLSDEGYMLLGSSEQVDQQSLAFRATRQGPAFVFRPQRLDSAESLPFPLHEDSDGASLDEPTVHFADQDAVRLLLRSGIDHSVRGAVDSAVACYEAATAYDPFTPEIHALLACAMRDADALQRAIDSLGKVLFLDPLNWWASCARAELYERSGDIVEARRHWKRALEGIDANYVPFDPSLRNGPLAGANDDLEVVRERCGTALGRLTRL